MKKRLLLLVFPTLIGIVTSCQKEKDLTNVKAEDSSVTIVKTVIDENSKRMNESLKAIAENLSKTEKSIYEKISENALKRNDGDNDFIYHKDKSLFGRNAINTIERGVNPEGLNNPYLNIYVYKGLNNENQDLKPYVFYFPVGIKDTEVDSLVGFIDGKLVKIDAKNPPEDIKNPIFVVGENERMHEVEVTNDDSFVVNNKVYAVKERYLTNKNSDDLTKRGGNGKMRVTFSRFGSMSDKRYYEPWGKGDAEVRFIFNKSYYTYNYLRVNPIKDMDMQTSSALIDGGYMYRSWWNYYSKDNYTTTPYFVDFYDEGQDLYTTYTMTLIEEDRYWGWIESLLDLAGNETIKFMEFKTTLLNDLKIKPQHIYEPSVREIYNDLVNSSDLSDFKATYNKLKTDSRFYFNISNNLTAQSDVHIKGSLLKAVVQTTLYFLNENRNTDDKMGGPITITRKNGKVYYTTDGRFRFKLEY